MTALATLNSDEFLKRTKVEKIDMKEQFEYGIERKYEATSSTLDA